MMKSVRQMALTLAIAGLAAPAFAQNPGSPYQTTRYAAPATLPEYVGYQPLPAVQAPVQQTSGYLLAARGNGPDLNGGPMPAPQPQNAPSVLSSPSDVESLPAPQYGSQPMQTQSGGTFAGPPVGGNCAGGNCGGSSGTYAPYEDNIGCGEYAGCGQFMGGCAPSWQVYTGAVFLGRTRNNKTWTTYETGNNPNQLMYFPDADWSAGPEVGITKYFGCDRCWGVQGVYYGVYNLDGANSIYSSTNQLSTPIDLGFVDYGGTPAVNFFDNAREHYVTRQDSFQNFELNFVKNLFGSPCAGGGCGGTPYSLQLLSGFRYINFQDNIVFGASQQDFGVDPATEAYLGVNVQNNLYGWQIGAMFQHNCTQNFSWFVTPKVGVFANQVDFSAASATGSGVQGNFTSTGDAFYLSNTKTDVALLGQIDLGVSYRIGQHWSLTGGYRVMGISGLAIADEQVPAYLAAQGDWTDIESSSATIFHGAFGGIQFCW